MGSGLPPNALFLGLPTSPYLQWHLDLFSCFSTVYARDLADTQTDHATVVTIDHILCYV